MNFQMVKLDFEKAEEPEIKLPTSAGLSKKQKSFRKASISALLPLTMDLKKLENSERDENIRPPHLPLENLNAGQEATVRTEHGTTD